MGDLTNIGFNLSATSVELNTIQQLIKNVLGPTANLNPTGSNGALIDQLTILENDVQSSLTYIYSGLYNPDTAYGVFLDSICKFDGITRIPATGSSVTVTVTGIAGTIIPANSQIINTNNDIFQNPSAITIGSNGTATGTFISVETGLIPVGANSVNRILRAISGWDTVNNPTDGTLGRPIETDYDLRNTRKYKLSINSANSTQALEAAFGAQTFIIDYVIVDLNSSSIVKSNLPTNIPTLSAGEIFISIAYEQSTENDQAIAAILANKLIPGVYMLGNYNVNYINPLYAWDSKTFTYQNAVPNQIIINITIKNSNNYPADIVSQIQQAIFNDFYGLGNQEKVKMGDNIYATRFIPPIIDLGIYNVMSITIGATGYPQSSSLTLPFDQYAVLQKSNISVNFTN